MCKMKVSSNASPVTGYKAGKKYIHLLPLGNITQESIESVFTDSIWIPAVQEPLHNLSDDKTKRL